MSFKTVSSVAKDLGVIPNTVLRWISAEKVNVNRLGRMILLDDDAAETLKVIHKRMKDKKRAVGAALAKTYPKAALKDGRFSKPPYSERMPPPTIVERNGGTGRPGEIAQLRTDLHTRLTKLEGDVAQLVSLISKHGIHLSTLVDDVTEIMRQLGVKK